MLTQAIAFLLRTFLDLFAAALLLRLFLQLVRAPAHNPLSYFLVELTDFIVRPARRVVPGLWGIDLSTLVLAWLAEFALGAALAWMRSDLASSAPGAVIVLIAAQAAVALLRIGDYIVMIAVVIYAVLSWVNPYGAMQPTLNILTRPFLRIFRKRVPPVGNVDLSPLFVIIVCQLMLIPIAWMEAQLYGLL